ncbi:MAG: hypothetical protein D084_Lepto4C00482G0003 [Leptospirillum sp. Group IV 'UBA BS']|nr:MAG: hypothetical protein D084_Lepto4C00482G0003 [Leptospirillum sp. Group IV 'UBA BS']
MNIREIVRAAGLGEHFDDFLDLVGIFAMLDKKHGGKEGDSIVTDDSPKYFLNKGAILLFSGDLGQVVENFTNIRTSGNHDLINICYEGEKYYLFQFPS